MIGFLSRALSRSHLLATTAGRTRPLFAFFSSTVASSPLSTRLEAQGKYISECLPKYIQQVSLYKDELTLYCAPSALIPVFTFLKHNSGTLYSQVTDIAGVDYPSRSVSFSSSASESTAPSSSTEKSPQGGYRFEVVYHLLSIPYNTRIRVKTYASEVSPVPSISSIYPGANWFEREAWDMYGIFFTGHPDLRRILTDYGFEGFPLRKDFPLTGYVEVRYDDEKKRVVAEPLELSQQFRSFDNASPWEQVGKGVPLPSSTPSKSS